MGLFSKKEDCPVCGGEVKGLFLKKIGDKKTLCKKCSSAVSMNKELLKTASPKFVREHLEYRKKNAERFASLYWDMVYTGIPGLKVGVCMEDRAFYLVHDDMNDDDNPVVFSFDQLVDYELYRFKKKVDSADDPGATQLDTALTALATISSFVSKDSNDTSYFILKLKTTDPYWEEIELKILFTNTQLHRPLGFAGEMQTVCQIFKRIVRKEMVIL